MIDGIQILNETVMQTADISNFILGIGTITFSLICLYVGILLCCSKEIAAGCVVFIITIFLIILSCLSFYYYFTKTTYTEYQVTISDSVKMNEFNEKYNIIKQEGKIFTITEKK